MGFVYDCQKILREIIKKRIRRLSRFSSGKMTRVVFYAVTVTNLPYHGHIGFGPSFQPLCFEGFTSLLEFFELGFKFGGNLFQRSFSVLWRCYEMLGGGDIDFVDGLGFPRFKSLHGVYLVYFFYQAVFYFQIIDIFNARRHYLPVIAPNPKGPPLKVARCSCKLEFDQFFYKLRSFYFQAGFQFDYVFGVSFGSPQAVNA